MVSKTYYVFDTILCKQCSIFFNALADERPLEERRQIIEDYYGTYRDLVRTSPAGHGMDYVHAYTVISKIS